MNARTSAHPTNHSPTKALSVKPTGLSVIQSLGHFARMTTFDTSQIQWRVPWHAVSPDYAAKAEAEIHREMCRGHVLFGRSVTAVGYRQDCDDVLFYLGASAPSFAVVHLTWQPERETRWPETTLFDSLDSWLQQCLIPDAEEFAS